MSTPLTFELVRLLQVNKVARKYGCLRHYTELSADVAAELAKVPTSYLQLDGLRQLSDQVAEALSGFAGELSLDGLMDISVPAIRSLSQACTKLKLGGLKRITDEQAAALLNFPGELSMCGLEVIGEARVQVQLLERLLDSRRTNFNHFQLSNLSCGALRILCQYARYLDVDTPSVSVEQANILAEHRGRLSLYGLNTLEPEIARILVRHDGPLELYGGEELWIESLPWGTWVELCDFEDHLRVQVRSMSDDVARLLAERYRGTITLECLVDVSDDSLFYLSQLNTAGVSISNSKTGDESAFRCVEVPGLGFEVWDDSPGKLHLMSELCRRHSAAGIAEANGLDEATVTALLPERFDLQVLTVPEFWRIKRMSPGIAKILSQHPGGVIIRRLDELTPEVALALSGSVRGIGIRSIASFDRETAGILTQCQGIFGGISEMDDIPEGPEYVQLLKLYMDQCVERGDCISLNTASLHVGIAEELLRIESPHPSLFLSGLQSLSYSSAEILSQWKGKIHFGCPQLGDDTARLLAKFRATRLELELENITAEIAAGLAEYRGKLWLGVKELSDVAAEYLSRHRDELELPLLESLTPVGAEHLAKHRPRIQRPTSALGRNLELCTSRLFRSR